MLQHLIDLRIPFAVVCANGILGESNVFVLHEADYRSHKTITGFTPAYSMLQLVERELTPADLSEFNKARHSDAWTGINLGAHGRAYELTGRSFRAHYRMHTGRRKQLAEAGIPQTFDK